MIRTVMLDRAFEVSRSGHEELIEEWRRSREGVLWVILEDEPCDPERHLLEEELGFHPLAVQQAQLDRYPPKFERFNDHSFLLLKGLDARSSDLDFDTIQLALFVRERLLVTRSSGPSKSTERLLEKLERGEIEPPEGGVAEVGLAVELCRLVVGRYLPILLRVEAETEGMESEMLQKPSDDVLARLVAQKADLRRLLRVDTYHAQVFREARSCKAFGSAVEDLLFEELIEGVERQLSLARLTLEVTDDLVNGYLSVSAHRLNQIMKTLTIVTVIFVPITFMAGLYGMNFEYIPELSFRYGYFFLLSAMLAVAIGVLVTFWRRGWLGER